MARPYSDDSVLRILSVLGVLGILGILQDAKKAGYGSLPFYL